MKLKIEKNRKKIQKIHINTIGNRKQRKEKEDSETNGKIEKKKRTDEQEGKMTIVNHGQSLVATCSVNSSK